MGAASGAWPEPQEKAAETTVQSEREQTAPEPVRARVRQAETEMEVVG